MENTKKTENIAKTNQIEKNEKIGQNQNHEQQEQKEQAGKIENMKRMLVICDNIHEINRLRRAFGNNFIIKATSSMQSGTIAAENLESDVVIYNIGSDFKYLFTFYKMLRKNKKTEEIPLIIIADFAVLKTLTDLVEMKKTNIVGAAISHENLFTLVSSLTED